MIFPWSKLLPLRFPSIKIVWDLPYLYSYCIKLCEYYAISWRKEAFSINTFLILTILNWSPAPAILFISTPELLEMSDLVRQICLIKDDIILH